MKRKTCVCYVLLIMFSLIPSIVIPSTFLNLIGVDVKVPKSIEHRIKVQDELIKTVENFPEDVRIQFNIAMNEILNKNILPLMEDIDKRNDKYFVKTDALIDKYMITINNIIKGSILEFERANINTVESIKENIIKQSATEINHLRENMTRDIIHIFNMLDCKLRANIELIKKSFRLNMVECFYYDLINNKCFETAKLDRNLYGKYGVDYKFMKCQSFSSITEDTPIETIKDIYISLIGTASIMPCIITPNSEILAVQEYYLKEVMTLSDKYYLWESLSKW